MAGTYPTTLPQFARYKVTEVMHDAWYVHDYQKQALNLASQDDGLELGDQFEGPELCNVLHPLIKIFVALLEPDISTLLNPVVSPGSHKAKFREGAIARLEQVFQLHPHSHGLGFRV